MSGLAEVLIGRGFTVTGSDMKHSELTDRLEQDGARIFYGQRAENIEDGIDLVVYTAAIHPDNPELMAAVDKGLTVIPRADLLGEFMRNYPISLAIAGTHGKTTTTSMISEILLAAGCDPTVTVGGMLDSIGGNIRVGHSDIFVAEACEYTNSFLSFFPTTGIILNIREDHLDFFKDIDDIRHSFRLFAENIPAGGLLIVSSDIEELHVVTDGLPCRILKVGAFEDDDYRLEDLEFTADGRGCFTVYEKSTGERAHITLGVPGEHNVYNSLAAIASVRDLGISWEHIAQGLASFTGTHRRFEKKGELGGITVIDDYAHHPDEITATLKTARGFKDRRIVCVFQPHTYSRTKALFEEFAEALSLADVVVLADIYAARETDTLGVSSELLADRIREKGTESYYFPTFDEIIDFLLINSIDGDLLITMGAGDVNIIGEKLLGQ